jgi:Pretoxin HINT domain
MDNRLRFGKGLRRILNRLVTASFGGRAFGCLVFSILGLLVGLTGRAEAAALVPVSIVVSSGETAHSECVSKPICRYGVTPGSASMDANSRLKALAPTRSLCSQNCRRNAFDATARIVAEHDREGVVASRQFRYDPRSTSTTASEFIATKVAPNCLKHSFRRDTEVVMADGSRKAMSEVEVGDLVLAADPVTGENAVRTVTALWLHEDTELAEVTVVDGDGDVSVIHTTQRHPFWNFSESVWTDAGRLVGGDRLRSNSEQLMTVVSVRSFAGVQWMYDLTVDELHTYYVASGDEPILVHNCGGLIRDTQGLTHSFDRHSAQWFGRGVSKETHLEQWTELLEQAASSSKTFTWSTGSSATRAHLARIDGKNFVVQFFADGPRAGEVATAFVPSQRQLTAMLRAVGK